MDLEKLETIAKLVLKDLSGYSRYTELGINPHLEARVKNLINLAHKSLPEHEELLVTAYRELRYVGQANSVITHLLEILEIEKSSKMKIKEMKIFESAEEKMKQAGLSFRK